MKESRHNTLLAGDTTAPSSFKLWTKSEGSYVWKAIDLAKPPVRGVLLEDDKFLVVGCRDGEVYLFDLRADPTQPKLL